MKIVCPACGEPVLPANWNVATDVAICAKCAEAFSISEELEASPSPLGFDIQSPPRGAWYEDTFTGWRAGATTRSALALFLVPFMCVWPGFSLGGIYGMQIAKGEFDLGLSLFGIPFLLGTLLFGSFAVMSICGKLVIAVDGSEGRVFTGVGPLGWSRRFDWTTITAVDEVYSARSGNGNSGMQIALVGQSRLLFGSLLSDSRRYYILQVLRSKLRGDR